MGRPSIRVRLTLLYGVMFFVAGAVVIMASYLLVSNILNARLGPEAPARVLARAALPGAVDPLEGLKENVLLGRLIPAGTGFLARRV